MGFKGTPNQYKIKIPSFNLPANVQLYIIDNYLNIVQPMQLGSEYVFNITNDTASQGDGRFYLNATLINNNPVTSVTTTTDKNVSLKVSIAPNPAVDATNISFEGVQSGNNVSVSITNVNGQEVYNVNVKETANGKVNVPLQYLSSGVYMVKVTSGNETVTKQLVKN
jgi:FAD synthase